MTTFHAVLWCDHHTAQLLQFDADHHSSQRLQAHPHPTRQHGSAVRSAHRFFDEVCDALSGIAEVLVTGPHTALADLRHHIDTHRPALAATMAGWQAVDHPTQAQLLALARQFFAGHDRMVGLPR